jgi:hypothetical protein
MTDNGLEQIADITCGTCAVSHHPQFHSANRQFAYAKYWMKIGTLIVG